MVVGVADLDVGGDGVARVTQPAAEDAFGGQEFYGAFYHDRSLGKIK